MNILFTVLHAFAALLASWRITELFVLDRITEPLRKRIPTYLLTCPRCMSVWAGMVTTALFIFCPWVNWPFAFALLYLMHNDFAYGRRTSRNGRQLIVSVFPDGTAKLVRAELSPQEIQQTLRVLVPPSPGVQPPTNA